MAYLVSQMRKDKNTQYMTYVPITSTTIMTPNPFGNTKNPYEDFALTPTQGTFSSNQVYYLRFKIHKIPQYFYSGSKSNQEVATYIDADNLRLQIILIESNQLVDEQENPPELIGTCSIPRSLFNQDEEYSTFSFIFTPSKDTFKYLGFRIDRTSFDEINYQNNGYRRWLLDAETDVTTSRYTGGVDAQGNPDQVEVTTTGDRIAWQKNSDITNSDFCKLTNLVGLSKGTSGWVKFGYQCRPGSLVVVNKEPVRLGRSGIYEINNGTIIDSFMIASPGGSDNNVIDAFLLDYAYKK